MDFTTTSLFNNNIIIAPTADSWRKRYIMSRFEKFNKKRTVNESINTDELEFMPLKEFVNEDVQIFGFFFTEGDYGRQVVLVSRDALINMPARAVADFEEMASDDETVDAIINGELTLHVGDIIKAKKKGRKDTVAFVYMDTPSKRNK